MKASASGPVTGYKEVNHLGSNPCTLRVTSTPQDRGSRVVGDLAKQTITIKKAPLSDGQVSDRFRGLDPLSDDEQIKRLSHMYTTRFATSGTA